MEFNRLKNKVTQSQQDPKQQSGKIGEPVTFAGKAGTHDDSLGGGCNQKENGAKRGRRVPGTRYFVEKPAHARQRKKPVTNPFDQKTLQSGGESHIKNRKLKKWGRKPNLMPKKKRNRATSKPETH